MHIRKTEFITEIVLSLFVVIITLESQSNPQFSVAAIALIHSLNLARAFEAYQEAQRNIRHESNTET